MVSHLESFYVTLIHRKMLELKRSIGDPLNEGQMRGVNNAKPNQMRAKIFFRIFFLADYPCIWRGSLFPDNKFSLESHFTAVQS